MSEVDLATLAARLRGVGLELAPALPRADYDALVPAPWRMARVAPDARTAALVAHGGRAFWAAFRSAPEASLERDPLDRFVARCVAEAAPGAVFADYSERREGAFAPLQRLAEAAGFGRVGRIQLVLHPRYGPWCSLRGILFLAAASPSPQPARFDPCTGCPAPCQGAPDPRRACVLGREHVYCAEQRAHHARAVAEAQRKGVP